MALGERVVQLIRAQGPIPFDRFMEMALYSEGGFYSFPNQVGSRGHFYTSPSAHPLFGALLALEWEEMWNLLGQPSPFWVVEVGSGSGGLARDILSFARHLEPAFSQALAYLTIDRGWPARVELARGHLRAKGIPLRSLTGVIFSNELLDSLPVHRVTQQGGAVKEIYVALDGEEWVELLGEPSTPLLGEYLDEVGIHLEEGQRAEIRLGMGPWMEEAARVLVRGYVITIDYGHLASELYSPLRFNGTLACYYRHTVSHDPYRHPGLQDITAHVDFTAAILAGERCGLTALGLTTQRQFLRNLGLHAFIEALPRLGLRPSVLRANQMALQNLWRPDGLGDFKVLVQGKGVPTEELDGLNPSSPHQSLSLASPPGLAVPLLHEEHIPLLAGRYPHLAWDEAEFGLGGEA